MLGTQNLGLTLFNVVTVLGEEAIPVLQLGPGATGLLAVLTGARGGEDSSGIPVAAKTNQQKSEVRRKCVGETQGMYVLSRFPC